MNQNILLCKHRTPLSFKSLHASIPQTLGPRKNEGKKSNFEKILDIGFQKRYNLNEYNTIFIHYQKERRIQ